MLPYVLSVLIAWKPTCTVIFGAPFSPRKGPLRNANEDVDTVGHQLGDRNRMGFRVDSHILKKTGTMLALSQMVGSDPHSVVGIFDFICAVV